MAKKEQLDELSKKTLISYFNKAEDEFLLRKMYPGGRTDKARKVAKRKIANREKGLGQVSDRMSGFMRSKVKYSGKKHMKEDVEELVASIVDQKPLETNQLFDKIMKDKLADKIDTYKTEYSKALFGGDKEAVDEIDKDLEAELDSLSDEELEYLSNLTDDEIESLLNVNPDTETQEEPAVEAPEAEETKQLDELSKEKLGKYITKAVDKVDDHSRMSKGSWDRNDKLSSKVHLNIKNDRKIGIENAVRKLTGKAKVVAKEETGPETESNG